MERALGEFLDAMAYGRGLAEASRAAYAADLRDLADFLARRGRKGWGEVSARDAAAYLRFLREGRGYAEATLLRHAAAMRSFFGWLAAEGRIEASPMEGFERARQPRRLPRTVGERPLNALIEAVDGDGPAEVRDRLALELLYGCGLRCSELTGLNLHDADLAAGTLRVRGKGGRERVVPFGAPAARALRRYLAWRADFAGRYRKGALAAALAGPKAPLLLSPTGRRLNRGHVAALVHARIHAFLPEGAGATPHTLRHAFATHLLDHGAPLLDIKELLGHASVETTQIYTHVSSAGLRAAFDRCFPRSR